MNITIMLSRLCDSEKKNNYMKNNVIKYIKQVSLSEGQRRPLVCYVFNQFISSVSLLSYTDHLMMLYKASLT